eukprot:scaffold43397_cov44-Prasinocladus_malaysianus.AAC.2
MGRSRPDTLVQQSDPSWTSALRAPKLRVTCTGTVPCVFPTFLRSGQEASTLQAYQSKSSAISVIAHRQS